MLLISNPKMFHITIPVQQGVKNSLGVKNHMKTYLTRSYLEKLEIPFVCILIISLITIPRITVLTFKKKQVHLNIVSEVEWL